MAQYHITFFFCQFHRHLEEIFGLSGSQCKRKSVCVARPRRRRRRCRKGREGRRERASIIHFMFSNSIAAEEKGEQREQPPSRSISKFCTLQGQFKPPSRVCSVQSGLTTGSLSLLSTMLPEGSSRPSACPMAQSRNLVPI